MTEFSENGLKECQVLFESIFRIFLTWDTTGDRIQKNKIMI